MGTLPSRHQRAAYLLSGLSLLLVLGMSTGLIPSAAAAPVGITIDARALAALGHMTFGVPGVTAPGGLPIASVQELDLEPGTYTLQAPAGGGSGAVTLPFTVTAACTLTVVSPQSSGDTTPPTPPAGLSVQ